MNESMTLERDRIDTPPENGEGPGTSAENGVTAGVNDTLPEASEPPSILGLSVDPPTEGVTPLTEAPHIESVDSPAATESPVTASSDSPAPEKPAAAPPLVQEFLKKVQDPEAEIKDNKGDNGQSDVLKTPEPTRDTPALSVRKDFTLANYSDQPSQYAENTQPKDSNADKSEAVPAPEKKFKLNLNGSSEEEIIDELTTIKGIKEKTAIFIVAQLVELRDMGVQFNSAADIRANITGLGKLKANLVAEKFDLTQIDFEENPDSEEQETADARWYDEMAEKWGGTIRKGVGALKAGIAAGFASAGAMTGGMLDKVVGQSRNSSVDLNQYKDATDQEKGSSALERVLAKIPKLNLLNERQKADLADIARGTAAVLVGAAIGGVSQDSQRFDVNVVTDVLSGHVQTVSANDILRAPYGEWLPQQSSSDVVRAPYGENSPVTTPTAEVNRENVDRPSEPAQELAEQKDTEDQNPADVFAAVPKPPVPASIASLDIVPDESIDYDGSPPIVIGSGPNVNPDVATAIKAPELPESPEEPAADAIAAKPASEAPGPGIIPDLTDGAGMARWNWPQSESAEATTSESNKGLEAAKAVAAATESASAPEVVQVGGGVQLFSEAEKQPVADEPAAIENAQLFVPTLGEQFDKTVDEVTAAKAIEKGGILSNEIDAFVAENNLPPDPEAENAMKNFYVFLNSGFPWTATPPNTQWQEFSSIEELNQGFQPPNTGFTLDAQNEKELYGLFHDPSTVTDEKTKALFNDMRSTAVNPTNMTKEQLETILREVLDETGQETAN